MAYTPSLNDIGEVDNTQNYSPSLNDIPQPTNPSLIPRVAGDIDTGLINAGIGLVDAPGNIARGIVGTFSPQAANQYFQPLINPISASKFGINNPNIGDEALQGLAQFAPYAAAGPAMLAARGLQAASVPGQAAQLSGLFGLTQSSNPITGMPLDAAAGAIPFVRPSMVGGYLAKFSAPEIAKSVGSSMDSLQNLTNQDAFNMAKANYNRYSQMEGDAWDNVSGQAKLADDNGAKFDNSDYKNALQNKLNDLSGQSQRQSGFARANDQGQQLLQGYMNDQHGTFQDAIEHNKALNQDYQNEITPGKSLPFNIVNYAKTNINQAIDDNINDNDLQETLGSAWNNANDITSQKNL